MGAADGRKGRVGRVDGRREVGVERRGVGGMTREKEQGKEVGRGEARKREEGRWGAEWGAERKWLGDGRRRRGEARRGEQNGRRTRRRREGDEKSVEKSR